MIQVIIIFLILILLLAGLLGVAVMVHSGKLKHRDYDPFVNTDGNHEYYERSLIEKKEFAREHPDEKGVRTFRRLFSFLRK